MAPAPMSELMADHHPSDEALNLTAGSKRPPQEAERDAEVPLKKRKKVNFNLTLNLSEATREPSASPELLQRVPSEMSGSTAPGSDLDEQIPTTPGGRLQVERVDATFLTRAFYLLLTSKWQFDHLTPTQRVILLNVKGW